MSSESPAAREQATPAPSSDTQLAQRLGELIGAGMEVHYRPHKCGAALDSACATCLLVGLKIAPVVVAAAVAAREAEVRRQVAAEIEAHADEHFPKDGNAEQRRRRRSLLIGARVAVRPLITAEVAAEALRSGNYIVCDTEPES
jgi:hypothetical protein